MAQEIKQCQNCKQSFTIEPEDFKFYEKIQVPPPTFCPECRLQRRLAWRNERGLYHRKCDKCRKSIISVFSADSPFVVYCRPCWWSDSWDGLDYGIDFNPNKPYFLQLWELLKKTPVMSLFGLYHTLHNSDYVNMATEMKNCYLLTHSDYCENCLYGSMISGSKESVDNLMLQDSELCYETVNCQKCYKTVFSIDCERCIDSMFCRNCIGCSDCFGCVNLRNQKYHIFNRPYSKEEYKKELEKLNVHSYQNIVKERRRTYNFWNAFPQKYIHERHTVKVSGDYIYNCKNTRDSFVANDMEDSRFCSLVTPGKTTNAYDFTHYGIASDLMYETLQCGNHSSRILFSWFSLSNSQNVEYSIFAIGCKNVFGTVSLKKREYCILNKQYSKEKYEKLRNEIVSQMNHNPYKDRKENTYSYGEFFPIELSPFGYNVTTAQESFPLTKEQTLAQGYSWRDPEERNYQITMRNKDIPDHIKEVDDSILEEIIECANRKMENGEWKMEDNPQSSIFHHQFSNCATAFRLIKPELEFYRKIGLALPRLCPSCRFDERLNMRNSFRLWRRACQCAGIQSNNTIYRNTASHFHKDNPCPNEFETAYAPERPEIVYCEKCYLAEVV